VNLESVWQVLLPGCNVLAYLGTPTVITGPYKRETKEDLTQEERRPVTMETQTRVMQPQAREHLGQEAWRGRKDPLNGPSKALALPTSSPWPPGLQGCDRRHLCCLKPPVYNPLLQQPHGTPMAGSICWSEFLCFSCFPCRATQTPPSSLGTEPVFWRFLGCESGG
jgi:hypothetical protein